MRLFAQASLSKLRLTGIRRAPLEQFTFDALCTRDILFRMIQGAHAVGNGLGEDILTAGINHLADTMSLRKFKEGEPVTLRDRSGKNVFFVLSGKLEARVDGVESPLLEEKLNGEWVGEEAFFSLDYPLCRRAESIYAAVDSSVAVLPFQDLQDLGETQTELAMKLYIRFGQLLTGRVLQQLNPNAKSAPNAGKQTKSDEVLIQRTFKKQMKAAGKDPKEEEAAHPGVR